MATICTSVLSSQFRTYSIVAVTMVTETGTPLLTSTTHFTDKASVLTPEAVVTVTSPSSEEKNIATLQCFKLLMFLVVRRK